jgi:hypothetical protein
LQLLLLSGPDRELAAEIAAIVTTVVKRKNHCCEGEGKAGGGWKTAAAVRMSWKIKTKRKSVWKRRKKKRRMRTREILLCTTTASRKLEKTTRMETGSVSRFGSVQRKEIVGSAPMLRTLTATTTSLLSRKVPWCPNTLDYSSPCRH